MIECFTKLYLLLKEIIQDRNHCIKLFSSKDFKVTFQKSFLNSPFDKLILFPNQSCQYHSTSNFNIDFQSPLLLHQSVSISFSCFFSFRTSNEYWIAILTSKSHLLRNYIKLNCSEVFLFLKVLLFSLKAILILNNVQNPKICTCHNYFSGHYVFTNIGTLFLMVIVLGYCFQWMTYKKVFCDLYEPRKANVLTCKMKPRADLVFKKVIIFPKAKLWSMS